MPQHTSPNLKESYKILRLLGALMIAMGTLIILNIMMGSETSTDDHAGAQSQHVKFPAPTSPQATKS